MRWKVLSLTCTLWCVSRVQSALEQQRRQYEGVVRTVSAECEALQGALAERDDQLDRTLQRLNKWKRRYPPLCFACEPRASSGVLRVFAGWACVAEAP